MRFPTMNAHAAAQQAAPDVVLRGVAHAYSSSEGPVVALAPTDLTLDGGAAVALVGPAGSGKSTLLEILAGHLLPAEGQVLRGGDAHAGTASGVVIRASDPAGVRAQIARALATDADIWLLDEPWADATDNERVRLQQDLRWIWQQTGKTMVVATRGERDAVPFATRVINLDAGSNEIVSDVHVPARWVA